MILFIVVYSLGFMILLAFSYNKHKFLMRKCKIHSDKLLKEHCASCLLCRDKMGSYSNGLCMKAGDIIDNRAYIFDWPEIFYITKSALICESVLWPGFLMILLPILFIECGLPKLQYQQQKFIKHRKEKFLKSNRNNIKQQLRELQKNMNNHQPIIEK